MAEDLERNSDSESENEDLAIDALVRDSETESMKNGRRGRCKRNGSAGNRNDASAGSYGE